MVNTAAAARKKQDKGENPAGGTGRKSLGWAGTTFFSRNSQGVDKGDDAYRCSLQVLVFQKHKNSPLK